MKVKAYRVRVTGEMVVFATNGKEAKARAMDNLSGRCSHIDDGPSERFWIEWGGAAVNRIDHGLNPEDYFTEDEITDFLDQQHDTSVACKVCGTDLPALIGRVTDHLQYTHGYTRNIGGQYAREWVKGTPRTTGVDRCPD